MFTSAVMEVVSLSCPRRSGLRWPRVVRAVLYKTPSEKYSSAPKKDFKEQNPLGVHPFVVQASRGSFKPKKKKEKMAARKRCGKVPVWCLWSAIVVQRAEPPPALVHIHKFQNLRILKQGATISFLKTPLAETKVSLYLLNQFSNKKTLF